MDTDERNEDFQRLHQLITEQEDIRGFLDGMTSRAAASLTRMSGSPIACAVTLRRRKRSITIAGSSDKALVLDGIEQELGDGPCLEALRTSTTILINDSANDRRWPQYSKTMTAMGYASVLGIPVALGDAAAASLNFFGTATGTFTDEVIEEAVVFTDTAGQALRLALRIITAELLVADLRAAMESRTTVDLACGMLMRQNHCTQEEAFQLLLKASSSRHSKLRVIAEQIIRQSNAKEPITHFDD